MTMNRRQSGGDHDELIGQVVSEYFEALERGEHLELDQFVQRYPEIEDVLKSVLPALRIADSSFGRFGDEEGKTARQLGDFQILRQIGRGGWGSFMKPNRFRWNDESH